MSLAPGAEFQLPAGGVYVGRVRQPGFEHPLVATVRGEWVVDITSTVAPTVSHVCELADPVGHVSRAHGVRIGTLQDIMKNSIASDHTPTIPSLLSPLDLQSVKAAGVTFAASLLERVIEEQARGAPESAKAIRDSIVQLVGPSLANLRPGSEEAVQVKAQLLAAGIWSQYLEVGIGPDAEIFTKCPPMASVGFGADIGILPDSRWNNPEPEIVVVASSAGTIVGATLGNDVNLRDMEGRSALLLGRAKDNNASAAVGPFLRLFDDRFDLNQIQEAIVSITVEGRDGYCLSGASSMRQISRSPEELVCAAIGDHHQYPDGLALFLGTMFVPAEDRGEPGMGFTHEIGDRVTIRTDTLGTLRNRVAFAASCPPWTYGVRQLMRDLARAGLV